MRALRLHLTLPSAVGVFGSACRVSFAEPAPAAPGPPLHAASPPAPPRVTFEPCADAACGESSSRASILDTHAPTRRRVVVPPRASDCAPDRAELGRAAWSFVRPPCLRRDPLGHSCLPRVRSHALPPPPERPGVFSLSLSSLARAVTHDGGVFSGRTNSL